MKQEPCQDHRPAAVPEPGNASPPETMKFPFAPCAPGPDGSRPGGAPGPRHVSPGWTICPAELDATRPGYSSAGSSPNSAMVNTGPSTQT